MITIRTALSTTAAVVALLASAAAQAAVVYNNGAPDTVTGVEAAEWLEASDFSLRHDSTLTGATVFLFADSFTPVPGIPISYSVNADTGAAGGGVGDVLTAGNGLNVSYVDTGKTFVGFPIFAVTFDFADTFAASRDTHYWLSIHVGDDFVEKDIFWASTRANGTFLDQGNFLGTSGYVSDPDEPTELAFRLEGTGGGVPEPSAWWLMIGGFGVAGATFRARRRAEAPT